jgi:UDP-2-acetamido-2,6-beta-L-arabino-hexul-4-ose reductase
VKILITGANGFIGKNLLAELQNQGCNDILTFTRENSFEDLALYTRECEFVFHLAGVNRTENDNEFISGNADLTGMLLEQLRLNNNRSPVLFSSSIHAGKDNPYGQSKKLAEQHLFSHSETNNSKVLIYRLPNLFGKWGKPHYNSVVTTFCYNIANGYPISISDEKKVLTLNYIDDVINEFMMALTNNETRKDDYCIVPHIHEITLGDLADKIYAFKQNRETLLMPSLETAFDKALYGTYLSYLNRDCFSYRLHKRSDVRGWLAEFMKSESMGQLFISRTKPGITRGNHWHHSKVEKFLVVKGQASIKFRKVGANSIIEYKVNGDEPEVVDIPAGYTHSLENIGNDELITLFWSSEIFDQERPDTFFMEV